MQNVGRGAETPLQVLDAHYYLLVYLSQIPPRVKSTEVCSEFTENWNFLYT